jgi:hypothetical protein
VHTAQATATETVETRVAPRPARDASTYFYLCAHTFNVSCLASLTMRSMTMQEEVACDKLMDKL